MPSISALSTYTPDWPTQEANFKETEFKARENNKQAAKSKSQNAAVSYKTTSKPFQQLISLSDRQFKQSIDITVDEALDSLGVESGHIKGSTVDKIQKGYQEVSYDIDLHVRLKADSHEAWEEKISAIRTQLNEFFSQKVKDRYQNAQRAFKLSDWVRTVPSHSQGDFRQTILSLGYSSAGRTTVDINFTNKNEVCYDTVSSSKHIEFNRKKKTAGLKEPWCPSIQTWLTENKWFVFNSAIDGGLKRLSYRLCQTPGAKGLQPGLAEYFFDKADVGLIREIYKRTLYGEYPNMQRTEAALEGLWKPVIDALLNDPGDGNDKQLETMTLSTWAGCTSTEQFQQKLSDNFPALCEKWIQGAAVGGDLRDMIKSAIEQLEDPKAILKPFINEAMGFEIVQAETFFASIAQFKLKRWDEFHQLQFSQLAKPYLQFIEHCGQQPWAARATHTLGWGEGKPDESLAFFLDLATEVHGSGAGPEWAKAHAINILVNMAEHEDPLQILTRHTRTGQLPLERAQIHKLLTQCLESDLLKTCVGGVSDRPRQFDLLIELLDRHYTVIDKLMGAGKPPDKASSKALLDHCLRLHADCNTGVLPLLRNILKKSGNKLLIQLQGVELTVNPESGLVSKSTLAERGYNAHRQYSIVGNGRKQNATVNVEWFGFGEFTGEQFREEPNLVMGEHKLEWTKSHEQSPPLLTFGLNMVKSLWGDKPHTLSKLSAQGTSQLQNLLEYSPNSLSPLLIEHGQSTFTSEQDGTRIIFVFENKQAKGIHIGFREDQSMAKVAALIVNHANVASNPWKQQPTVEKLAWNKEVSVPTFGVVKLHNLPAILPCGSIETEAFTIHQQGDLSWHGSLFNGDFLIGARLFDKNEKLTLLQFPSNDEQSDPIPVEALPLFSEICHLSVNGQYPFKARYLDCSTKQLQTGYEGFVHEFRMGPYTFSGYITASDRAMGILTRENKQYLGNFLLFRNNLDNTLKTSMGYSDSDDKCLVPHGRCTMVSTSRNDPSTEISREYVYSFWQFSISNNQKQYRNKPFDVPGMPLEFKIVTEEKKSEKEEVWFQMSHGHNDFFLARPLNYATLRNYKLEYRDTCGFHCKVLFINGKVSQGTLEFPNGLTYTGQLELRGNTLRLQGQGKISWDDAIFKGVFDDDKVRMPTALTPETKVWLNLFLTGKNNDEILLDELFNNFSGQPKLFSEYMTKKLELKHDISNE